jgi:glycosyltransferase involved in cell wall biosynthesis/Flp pilus assembly protein TadD
MRFLFVHQNSPAQYKHILAHMAAVPGNEVVVLTQTGDRPLPAGVRRVVYQSAEANGVGHPWLRLANEGVRNAEAVLHTCQELKKSGFTPDIMIGHNAWGETLFLKDVWPSAPLLGYFEFFYAGRGQDCGFDPEFGSSSNDPSRTRTMNTLNLLGMQAADWGQSPTDYQRTRYPAIFQQKISTFHEGIDTDRLRPNPRMQVNLPDGTLLSRSDEVITYVSRSLEPYRGFHVFMRALPEILARRPKARVLIVGGDDVSYGARLAGGKSFREALLEEQKGKIDLNRVSFFGRIPYDHYLGILQVSSVHVYLTYPFVLSWSMIEAMSCGCLVVGSATPPVQEVISDGRNGLLTDFFNTRLIADRIDEVFSHPDRMQGLRTAARQTVMDRYDLRSICMPQYLRVIDDLVNGRTPPVGVVPLDPAHLAPAHLAPAPLTPAPVAGSQQMTLNDAIAFGSRAEAEGRVADAERIYRDILRQRPELHGIHYKLGILLYKSDRFAEAALSLEKARDLSPTNAHYHGDLGVTYKALKRREERLACYRRAAELSPENDLILMNLGSALADGGQHDKAEIVLVRAHLINPGNFGVLTNLGNARMRTGNIDQAVLDYQRAIRLNPSFSDTRKNLGMCLFLKGDLQTGAPHYESRLLGADVPQRDFTQPRWDGGPFAGKTLLIHAEQGLGDMVHFCRYVPLAKAMGGRVVLECHWSLVPLLRDLDGADEVVAMGAPLPPFDIHCPVMSLVLAFGTTLDTIPAQVPYLPVQPAKAEAWRTRLAGESRRKIGLVWAGSPTFGADRHRSVPLSLLAPLLDVPDTAFYSLQVGPAQEQLAGSGLANRLTDLSGDLKDFSDTAALVQQLDLVISVDTAVAHLAGGLNRPVWIMIPHAWLDWRWLLDRQDSPWYPSAKLFRQQPGQDWTAVVADLRDELMKKAG